MMSVTQKYVWKVLLSAAVILLLFNAIAATSFDPDQQPIGYVGQPAVSSNIMLSGTEHMYSIDYSSVDWSGNLHSYALSSSGAISTIDDWTGGAAQQINSQATRFIATLKEDGSKIGFQWNQLSTAQKSALVDTDVLSYIRGVRANETPNGNKWRSRKSVLGDIIHSTPVYWDDGTDKTVFVGANDGMLHAINADNGKERFAYIPSMLILKLASLKDAAYVHKNYVDGRLAIREFDGKTILAGALGGGGKGLFGLDVSNVTVTSDADAAAKILWEITNAKTGFANLGYTYGDLTLARLDDNTAVLAVGNGYNNSGNGHAVLYLINPLNGTLLHEIDTGSGSAASPNGLSSPTLWDSNGDGRADTAYAGDIDGHLWKFNLLTNTSTLLNTSNPAQAITMAPAIKVHPLGGVMLNYVTGRLLTADDQKDAAIHYAYGIWDGAPAANTTLLAQTLTEKTYSSSTRVRTATSNFPDWSEGSGHHKGWKTALPIGGERVVGDGAIITGSVFLFMSTNPLANPTATPSGENWWMQLNALTGGDNGGVLFDLNKDGVVTIEDRTSEGGSPVGRNMGGGTRSQLIALSADGYEVYQSNFDRNGAAPPPTTVGDDKGVAGGHFDEDIYYGTSLTASKPSSQTHNHEYDDIYDVTGVNMLDASNAGFDLVKAIASAATNFKVLVQNQYLNPAVKIHLNGSPGYVYNLNQGYIPISQFMTSATLDVTNAAQVPTYNRANIKSLAINMPVDAFTPKDWWSGALGLPADVRVGLHPTQTNCVKQAAGTNDGNMYQPVIPPVGVTSSGNGTLGYNSGTTALTATGVRHNGALVIQIISSSTPNSAIEMSVPNRPQYGWRVKSGSVKEYVLAEYTTFWHEKLIGACYGESGWSKVAATDTRICGSKDNSTERKCVGAKSADSGTDPHIGGFGSGSGGGSTPGSTETTTVNNADGTVTITVIVTNSDGSTTTTVTTVNAGIETGGAVNLSGIINGDGEIGGQLPFGRVNWRELPQ